jgi:hypothetical protein
VNTAAAAQLMAPLFGVQELRGAAAHLGDQLVGDALPKVEVDPDAPTPEQGRALLTSFVDTLIAVGDLFLAQQNRGRSAYEGGK